MNLQKRDLLIKYILSYLISPYGNADVHRERQGVDEFQLTSSQHFEERADTYGWALAIVCITAAVPA